MRCLGKGRKHALHPRSPPRPATPRGLARRTRGEPDDPLFPTRRGRTSQPRRRRTLVLTHHAASAASTPSLRPKTSHPMCSVTRPQCGSSTPAWTASDRPLARPRASPSTDPDLRSCRPEHQRTRPRQDHPTHVPPDATDHPTGSSPSWKPCDYADNIDVRRQGARHPKGFLHAPPRPCRHSRGLRDRSTLCRCPHRSTKLTS